MGFRISYAPWESNASKEWLNPAIRFSTYTSAENWAAENRWCEKCRDEHRRRRAGVPSINRDNGTEYYDTPCDAEWWIYDEKEK